VLFHDDDVRAQHDLEPAAAGDAVDRRDDRLVEIARIVKPPKPPTPQSASDFWPAAAAFRSQPGEKNRSPAPVMMAILRDGSSRNSVTTALRRRLAARSMALALGRSMVISRTSPALTVVTPSDMCAPLYMYRCGLIISSAS